MEFEFVVEEKNRYVVVASGETLQDAKDEAMLIYFQRAKRNELGTPYATYIGIVEQERRK
jgi:hypothetical protein